MAKATKDKKGKPAQKPAAAPVRAYSPEAQEVRALLRRIPDGLKATLSCLANKTQADRERVLTELVRGLGKEVLPLVRAAAMSAHEELAQSALRTLPIFGTRAAADVLTEVHDAHPDTARASVARQSAKAFRARGIQAAVPEPDEAPEPPHYALRETWVSAPDGVGSRSVVARLQDQYGVWHAILVLWNDQAGIKDGFMRPLSRQEWEERARRMDERGTSQVLCPPDFARWQVAEARRLNDESGLALGTALSDWDTHLGAPPADYQPPNPTASLEAAAPEVQAQVLAEGAALIKMPDAARWFLEAADCAPWARRWTDLQNRLRYRGAEAEPEGVRAEITDLVYEATEALMDERQRELYRGRLLDFARVMEWRRLDESARQASAVALAIKRGTPSTAIPFLVALVEWSLRATEVLVTRGEDLERLRYRPLRRRHL